jgi:hypothetical protein
MLLTAPSLRSDFVAPTFEKSQRRCAGEAQDLWRGENIMMVLLAYFLIAAVAGIAASAIAGYFLANVISRRFTRS